MTRVAAAGLIAGSLAGALALRPAPARTPARTATQTGLQAAAVQQVQAHQAALDAVARARAQAAALRASRALAASRHRAYLRARAAQAAALRVRAARAVPVTVVTVRAATVRTAPVRETPAARGQRVYAQLHYDVEALGYRIVFKPSVHGLLGLTDAINRTITVYVRSGETDLVLAHSIAHELGHALDFTRGSAATHALYLTIRHLGTGLAWYGCNSCSDYATPAGDWAEVFAQWLAGRGDFRSQLAAAPSSAQLSLLTPLFRL